MSVRNPRYEAAIEYPETDGEPMAETDVHAQLMMDLRLALSDFFRDDPEVYVSSNLLLYYIEGNPYRRVAPDVFMVRGVSKGQRRVYKLWEEGRAPDVVIELSSRETWREDVDKKYELYEQLGVKEYFIFDPEYDYLPNPLVGYRLKDCQYVALKVRKGRVRSEVLGLDLVDTGETLRLWDPRTGQFLPTGLEEASARRAAEDARRTEHEARLHAEAETARLREELERLRSAAPSDPRAS